MTKKSYSRQWNISHLETGSLYYIQPNAGKPRWRFSNPKRRHMDVKCQLNYQKKYWNKVDNCPSGALSYERNNKMSEQKRNPNNSNNHKLPSRLTKGGPYLVKENLYLLEQNGKEETKEGS